MRTLTPHTCYFLGLVAYMAYMGATGHVPRWRRLAPRTQRAWHAAAEAAYAQNNRAVSWREVANSPEEYLVLRSRGPVGLATGRCACCEEERGCPCRP